MAVSLPSALRSLRCSVGLSFRRPLASLATTSAQPAQSISTPLNIDEAYTSKSKIDVETLFLSKRVRSLLMELTGLDLDRIYATRPREFTVPKYRLLTEQQLQDEVASAVRKAQRRIQMPPVMRLRQPCERVLRRDPELQGLETSAFVFTDISFGHGDRERPIVVREPDGTLRTAGWFERERMLQTYFTRPEREMETPRMFTEPHLTAVLNRGWYAFVLDRACVQFEPDSEGYLGVTQHVYDHVATDGHKTGGFDALRSTRHFGPMCLYFAVTRKGGDALMLDMLKQGRIDDGAAFVRLLHIVHPDSRSATEVTEESSAEDYVQAYIKLEAQNKPALELALQTYREVQQQQQQQEESKTA